MASGWAFRVRRMTAAFSAVAVLLAALSAYYAWSASQIQQNYLESLKNQSQYLSAESLTLLENGDRMSAMLLALEALPKDDKDERPVLPEAEYALSQAVNVIIGANSTVTHNIPDGVVAAGSPARVICTLEEYLAKERARMETAPRYGGEYTLRQNVPMEKRLQQKEEKTEKIGYID